MNTDKTAFSVQRYVIFFNQQKETFIFFVSTGKRSHRWRVRQTCATYTPI